MEQNEIKKNYEILRKKYTLPKFEDIDNDFEISCIDDGIFLTRDIIKKIIEKQEFFINSLNDILQPENLSITNIHECRQFDDNEKNKIYDILKKLVIINRESMALSIAPDEKKEAELIKKAFNEWNELKPNLIEIISKLIDSWKKDIELKEDLGYMG